MGRRWKDRIDSEVSRLSASMTKVAERMSMPELLQPHDGSRTSMVPTSPVVDAPRHFSTIQPATVGTEAESWSGIPDNDCGPAAIPASFVSEVTRQSSDAQATRQPMSRHDIISRGILTLDQAEMLFNQYITKHDNYIYSVLEEGSTFSTVRTISPLLLTAICAVTSLHVFSSDIPYERCYEEFVHLSASHVVSSKNNLDDIRAMCIGAFWLPDLSWSLVGNAVRIATEMQLHRAYRRAIAGDRRAYVAARLYYLVHVCDHQFSIAYGRPPLTGEYEAVLSAEKFLTSEFAIEDDARLISQVELWSVSSNVFVTFGTDIQQPIPINLIGKLQRFSLSLDSIRLKWNEAFKPHAHIGNYPRKGVGLHYHFAKLYLCSHVFRGISTSATGKVEMSLEVREIADAAVLSATSILRSINSDKEFQSFMSDLPLYFDTMIAFASVFLFRISTSYSHAIRVDASEILRLLRESVNVLEEVTSNIRHAHLLARITEGLKELLGQFEGARNRADQIASVGSLGVPDTDMHLPEAMDFNLGQFDWPAANLTNGFSMGNYDFLSSHQMLSGFEMWPMEPDKQHYSEHF